MTRIPDIKQQILNFILTKRPRNVWVEKETCLFQLARWYDPRVVRYVRLRVTLGLGVFSQLIWEVTTQLD